MAHGKPGRLTDEELDRKFNGNTVERGGAPLSAGSTLLTHHTFTEEQLRDEKGVLTFPNLPPESKKPEAGRKGFASMKTGRRK